MTNLEKQIFKKSSFQFYGIKKGFAISNLSTVLPLFAVFWPTWLAASTKSLKFTLFLSRPQGKASIF